MATVAVLHLFTVLIPPTSSSQELAEGVVASIKILSFHLDNVSKIRQGLAETVCFSPSHRYSPISLVCPNPLCIRSPIPLSLLIFTAIQRHTPQSCPSLVVEAVQPIVPRIA
jgi:hypothetical protein